LTYEKWILQVEQIIESILLLTLEDLPDWLSHDSFEAGDTPQQGAKKCLANLADHKFEFEIGVLFDEL